jgi:hypothetical protein
MQIAKMVDELGRIEHLEVEAGDRHPEGERVE